MLKTSTKLNLLISGPDAHRLTGVARRRGLFAQAGRYVGEPSRSQLVKGLASGEIISIGPLTPEEWRTVAADLELFCADFPEDAPSVRVMSQVLTEAKLAAGVRAEA